MACDGVVAGSADELTQSPKPPLSASSTSALSTARSAGSAWRSKRTASTWPIRRRRPGWDELTTVIAALPPLPGGSVVTVEPGGAVELSGPPMDRGAAAIAAMVADRAVLRGASPRPGFGLVLLGADPLRPAAAGQPRRPVPGDGEVLRRQPDAAPPGRR